MCKEVDKSTVLSCSLKPKKGEALALVITGILPNTRHMITTQSPGNKKRKLSLAPRNQIQATSRVLFPYNTVSVDNTNVGCATPIRALKRRRFILLTFLSIHGLSCLLKRPTNPTLVLLVFPSMKLMSFST
jgi:hypothetical protein